MKCSSGVSGILRRTMTFRSARQAQTQHLKRAATCAMRATYIGYENLRVNLCIIKYCSSVVSFHRLLGQLLNENHRRLTKARGDIEHAADSGHFETNRRLTRRRAFEERAFRRTFRLTRTERRVFKQCLEELRTAKRVRERHVPRRGVRAPLELLRKLTVIAKASIIESSIKSGLPGVAKGSKAAADIRESMATGPVCN